MLLKINPDNPQERLITRVVEILQSGGIIVYPTDTNYGIGCDLFQKRAIETIRRIKQVDKGKLFSFICADLTDISQYANVSNFAYRTMRRLLPGPYTFVLEASSQVPRMMLSKRKTVGIRVPDYLIARRLASRLGRPIVSASARIGDEEVLHDSQDIISRVGKQVEVVIDAGIINSEHSSVISLVDDQVEVIRAGKGDVSMFL